MKSWLQDNDIEIYSANNEGKSVVAERFFRTLKLQIYDFSIKKNKYSDQLAETVNKYNNTYHSTIKMKPADVNLRAYVDLNKENKKENPKFEVGDHVRISKYKSIFAKSYTAKCSEEVFAIKKNISIVLWTHISNLINAKEIVGTFYEKKLQKPNQKEFRVEKVIKRKSN